MKIWHDDVRPAPEGWTRARTNAEALKLLTENWGRVECISMDHDLGSTEEGNLFAMGRGDETGVDLARAMVKRDLVPPKVFIHSWNPEGARRMARIIEHGAEHAAVVVEPFRIR